MIWRIPSFNSGEEIVTAKFTPMKNLVARCSESTPVTLSSIASESPGKIRHESRTLLNRQTEQYDRTEGPVLCSQHTDRFVIANDETKFSRRSRIKIVVPRSFLHRVNDQVLKRQKQSSEDSTKESDKHFNMVNFGVFNISSICMHGEELHGHWAF